MFYPHPLILRVPVDVFRRRHHPELHTLAFRRDIRPHNRFVVPPSGGSNLLAEDSYQKQLMLDGKPARIAILGTLTSR